MKYLVTFYDMNLLNGPRFSQRAFSSKKEAKRFMKSGYDAGDGHTYELYLFLEER